MDTILVKMKDFPCAFNLEGQPPSRQRLQHMKNNVTSDKMAGKYARMENVRNKNILTWLEYYLDTADNHAKDLNAEVIAETNGLNISSLGNRVFLLYHEGNDIDAGDHLKELERLRERADFDDLLTEAKAEQAYYHSRMGGFHHCQMSIRLFEEVVKINPDNHLWKFGLGLMHRRMTNFNVSYSVVNESDTSENIRLAKECLLAVTESDDEELQALAYTQLIILFNTYSTTQDGLCFQGFDIISLCEKALEKGGENPTVLSHCGRVFMASDIDRAIELIKKALSKRENTISFHNLGQCYERKAESILESGDEKLDDKTTEEGTKCTHVFESRDDTLDDSALDEGAKCSSVFESKSTKDTLQRLDIKHNIVLTRHLFCSKTQLDPSCEYVKKSESMYRKAITISKNENVPAMLSLGKLYTRLYRFKEALQVFKQIINLQQNSFSYLITLITAYEEAGKCLLELRKRHEDKSQEFYEQGREYLTKATSLAADLAAVKSGPKNCETSVWNSFEMLKADIASKGECKDKNKEYIRLLQIIRDYKSIVTVVNDILSSESLDDPEIVSCAVNSYLEIGQYENALTFVNMAGLGASGSVLKETEKLMSETCQTDYCRDEFIRVYLLVAWERLEKKSPDAKLVFQKSFAVKYGNRNIILTSREEELGADILVVSDYEIDCEEGLSQSTKSAMKFLTFISDVFGLTAVLNLEGSNQYGCFEDDLRLEEIKKYPVVVIILADEERGPFFEIILSLLHKLTNVYDQPINWFIIQSHDNIKLPDTILHCSERRRTLSDDDPTLSSLQSLCGAQEVKNGETAQSCSKDTDVESVMKLFCFLLRFDFKNIRDVYMRNKKITSETYQT